MKGAGGTTGGTAEQAAVLAGASSLRDLPWRRTRDPWAVLVSEVMLAQTQVARVAPRWERFLRRWPDPASCAAATLGDVLAEWQGLGYPRRARNLWAAAGRCVEAHGGEVPDSLADLLALPGVGPYTARAVLAFAHGRDVGVVDTNVARVLARRAGERLTPSAAQRAADAWVPAGAGWEWNQSLMDLGALRCRPEPRCDGCPVECAWAAAGHPDPDPAQGSAGVSRPQRPYAGSDRQARGRLLAALNDGPVPAAALGAVAGLEDDAERASRIADSLVADGLAALDGDGTLRHP